MSGTPSRPTRPPRSKSSSDQAFYGHSPGQYRVYPGPTSGKVRPSVHMKSRWAHFCGFFMPIGTENGPTATSGGREGRGIGRLSAKYARLVHCFSVQPKRVPCPCTLRECTSKLWPGNGYISQEIRIFAKINCFCHVSILNTTDAMRRGGVDGVLLLRAWQPGVVFSV